MKTETNTRTKVNTKTITLIAVMTAVIAIAAPFSIPIPISPVPISLTVLTGFMAAYLLGWKHGTIAYCIYLLLGLVGIPVFSGFTSGPAKLLGPTGGYLIGFIFMVIISGFFFEKFEGNILLGIAGMILGLLVTYAFGTAWLAVQAKMDLWSALMAGVIPYLPADAVKMAVVMVVCPVIKKRVQPAIQAY